MDRGNDVYMRINNIWEFSIISSNDRSNSLNTEPYRGGKTTRFI